MGLGNKAAALALAERAMAANPIEKDPLAGPFRNLLDVEFVERGAEVYVREWLQSSTSPLQDGLVPLRRERGND